MADSKIWSRRARTGLGGVAPAILLFCTATAGAQPMAPGSDGPRSPDGTEIERRVPQPAKLLRPPPTTATPTPEALPATTPEIPETFVVAAILFDGATVFESDAFIPLYRDLLARPIERRDLAALAEAVTEMYYDAGYTLSRAYVPPQDIQAGVVTIRVAEGFVERVRFEGDAGDAEVARRHADALTAERPLRRSTLERQMLLLGDLFGLRVEDARLRPIEAEAGRYELTLDLRHKPVDAYGYLDNRGTRSYGPLQLWTSAGVNAIGTGAWRAQVGFLTVPNTPREVLYAQGVLARTLGDDGTVGRFTVSGSRNIAGRPLKGSDSETSSSRFQATLSHPFRRSRTENLRGNLHVEALTSKEERFQRNSFEDHLRVVRPGFYYYRADNWGGENGANLEASFGVSGLGASHQGPERSRSDADTSFRKLRLDAWRNQNLSGPWSLNLQLSGQTSDHPLLSSEEFTLGGSRYGRGYDPSVISGDRALAGALELRFTERLDGSLSDYQIYSFYDAGRVSNGNVDTNARHRLASAGAGVRLTFEPAIRVNLELAKPLNAVEGREDREWRTFVTLAAEF